ncbi:MAG: isoprenylcysteine carboxylmethyltransferase family protein [Pseudomonadota bacterium]
MKRLGVLVYSVVNYALGVAALLYLIAFLFNLFVPVSIDSGAAGSTIAAVVADLGLILLFGLQHSIMARPGFKGWLTRLLPRAAERSTFMLATAVVTFTLCLLWQPLPTVLWQADSPVLHNILLGSGILGWVLVLYATCLINHFDLFGLRQAWLYFRGREYTHLPFKTAALYRYIRHPIMTGVFVGIWFTPVMTAGHLLFALGMSAYILVGVYHEEQDLIRSFGQRYLRYRRETGRFLPRLPARRSTTGRTASSGV